MCFSISNRAIDLHNILVLFLQQETKCASYFLFYFKNIIKILLNLNTVLKTHKHRSDADDHDNKAPSVLTVLSQQQNI